jgi:DNA-binding GntR family transcriptional regulator
MQIRKHPPSLDFGLLGISRSPSLTEQVAKHIAAAIDDGTFRPGDRLVETRLADMFGVSRGPIREALKALESENIVRIKPGRGTFVASPSSEDIEQIVAAWALLEGLAARTVVAQYDRTEVNRLNFLCKCMRDVVADRRNISDFLEIHWRFHDLLCNLSKNQILIQAWQSMRCQLRLFWRSVAIDISVIEKLSQDMFVLVDSLNGNDPDQADALFRSHIVTASYQVMNKPAPAWLQGYITLEIGSDRSVRKLRPAAAVETIKALTPGTNGLRSLSN